MKDLIDCVTIGSAIMDTFVQLRSVHHHEDVFQSGHADQCFPLGTKLDVPQIMQQSGGGATNSAVTFARQRLTTQIVTKVGDDAAGRIVLDDLAKDRVDTKMVIKAKGGKTGQSVILVDPNSERSILTDRGSSGHLSAEDLSVLDRVQARWAYVTSLNGSEEALDRVFQWADTKQVKVAWNPGIADIGKHTKHLSRWLKTVSLFIANHEEATLLLAEEGASDYLMTQLHAKGVKRAVISDGINASALLDDNQIWAVTPTEVNAIDRTGAGDALGSGTVAGLLQGRPFKQAVEQGMLNAEHVVMQLGAKTGIMYKK